MSRNHFTHLLTFVLTIITLMMVILAQLNVSVTFENYPEIIIYGVMTSFALYFSVEIKSGNLSMAHVIGIMAFLAYPAETSPFILLVIFFGGLIGGFLIALRNLLNSSELRWTHGVYSTLTTVIYVTARVTISYALAVAFYLQAQAPLPINSAESIRQFSETTLALVIFALIYILSFIFIYALQIYAEGLSVVRIFRENFAVINVILVATVPFAILAALSEPMQTSIVSFSIVIGGTMFSVLGLHTISHVNRKLQQQLDEVQSLSSMSQVLSTKLDLQSLYENLYAQLKSLMYIQNFKVILYQKETQTLEYAFVIEHDNPIKTTHTDDYDLIKQVIVDQQTIRLQDKSHNRFKTKDVHIPDHLVSWLGVPMWSGDTVVGGLIVSSTGSNRHFTPEDQHHCECDCQYCHRKHTVISATKHKCCPTSNLK